MAKVPTLNDIDVIQPTKINPKTAATLGGEVVDLGEGISALGDHMKKVQGMKDVREGLTGFNDDAIAIHDQISKEQDLDGALQKADDLYGKAIEARANKIPDPEAREIFLDKVEGARNRNLTATNSMIDSKRVKAANAGMTAYGESYVKQYSENLNRPDLQQQATDDFKSEAYYHGQMVGQPKELIDAYVNNTIYKAKVSEHTYNIDVNPTLALQKIKDDKDLTAKDSDKLQKEATSRIEQNQKKSVDLLKISQKKNFDDALMKKSIGAISANQIEEMLWTKRVTPEQYNSLIKNHLSPKKLSATTDKDSYLGAINMLTDPNVPMSKKQTALLDLNTDGKISTVDMKHLYQLHIIPNKGQDTALGETPQGKNDLQLLDKAQKDDEELQARSKAWFGVQGMIEGHSDDPHHVSDLMKQLHNEIGKENNITPDVIHEKAQGIISKDLREQLVKAKINVDGITDKGTVIMAGSVPLFVSRDSKGNLIYRNATDQEIEKAQGGE